MIRLASTLVLTLALAGGAQAATAECLVPRPGVSISFGFSIGSEFTESERNESNLRTLQRMGVDATAAEMWGGCIRAFVRKPGGGEEMQFFHPDTFERIMP